MEKESGRKELLPLVLHPNEVAEILNLSDDYARELFHRENFPSFTVGKRLVVLTSSLFCWLEQQENSKTR